MESNEVDKDSLFKLLEQTNVICSSNLRQQLIDYINTLLLHDFSKLVQILYRVDVNEKKLKLVLQENKETDAAIIIADLLIERQQEKIKSKEAFKSSDDIPDEEKW